VAQQIAPLYVKYQRQRRYNTLAYLTHYLFPKSKWLEISMDFVEGLPKSKGKDVILVVVDKLTNYWLTLILSGRLQNSSLTISSCMVLLL
jgi:hypothetical protein